jgi:hypothetical protein
MPDGRIVPFCAFNVLEELYRDYVQKAYKKFELKPLDLKGFNPGEKYRRKNYIEKILSNPIYWNAYKGIIYFKDEMPKELVDESGEELRITLRTTRLGQLT